MRKILLAIDAVKPDKGALDFAAYLGRLTKSTLTGVFLENIVAEETAVLKRKFGMTYVEWEVDENSDEHKFKMALIEKNITRFKEDCINRGVLYEVHRDGGVPATELVRESRFADALVVDAEMSFSKRFEGSPTGFVKEILAKAECPVIVAPDTFDAIDEVFFTYNETRSSFFAIKQFTYLFPELHDKKVTVIQVSELGEWRNDEKQKLTEWLEKYYTDFTFEAVRGRGGDELADHLFKKKNMLLVIGAYGRNAISRFFKNSQADLLIMETSQPIFIAH